MTLYHADCTEVLPHLPKVDLVLTDPPYGIREARGKNKSRGGPTKFGGKVGKFVAARDYGEASWDDSAPPTWQFDWLREKSRHQIIFGGDFFDLPPSSC